MNMNKNLFALRSLFSFILVFIVYCSSSTAMKMNRSEEVGLMDSPWHYLVNIVPKEASADEVADIIFLLIENNLDLERQDINAQNSYGETPLCRAVFNGHLDIVKYLIKNGAKINLEDNEYNDLYIASFRGHLSIVKHLIKLVSAENFERICCMLPMILYIAVEEGYLDIIEYLIKYSVKNQIIGIIDSKPKKDLTLLHYAVQNGHLEIVKYLIENGADRSIKSRTGQTPYDLALTRAADQGHIEIFKFFSEIMLEEKNKELNSVLDTLIIGTVVGDYDLVKEAITKLKSSYLSDNLFKDNKKCLKALKYAIKGSNQAIVTFLVESGVSINTKNNLGYTLLHYMADLNLLRSVEYLLEKGADVNSLDNYNCTPLYYAIRKRNLEFATILLNHGAVITKKAFKCAQKLEDNTILDFLHLQIQDGAPTNFFYVD